MIEITNILTIFNDWILINTMVLPISEKNILNAFLKIC